jgi:outer membrane lipoprotein-sorting protein
MIKLKYLLILLFLGNLSILIGQNTFLKPTDSDPKAKVVLDKMKALYNSYASLEAKFDLELELAEQPRKVLKGSYIQSGTKYIAKTADQEIYSDGKTTWIYIKPIKEVQISDASGSVDAGFMSPKQLITLYDKGEYVYTIVDERKIGTQSFVDIEFKPLKRRTDYSKLKMTIDKKTNKLVSLRVFSKDGSRYTLKMNEIVPNKKYDSGIFVFNTKNIPGVHVEDLRMD